MDLLILGASTRAAAFSALRASLRPTSIDLFADRDLAAVGLVLRIDRENYPDGFSALASKVPSSPWIYTGGLENAPDLVDRIAASRPLWGNGGAVLRAVRDPMELAARLRGAGLPCPDVRPTAGGLPRDATWLVKPLASSGGQGIHPLGPETPDPDRACYYQERIAGRACSAIFVGRGGRAALCGVTRQLTGRRGAEFAYAGSIGPWPLSLAVERRIRKLGETLARSFGLLGLFGVDLVLRDEIPWPVEVNPRYTASVEVLERSLGRSLLREHCAACDPEAITPTPKPVFMTPRFVGKLILDAPAPCRFPDLIGWRLKPRDLQGVPRLGDVPVPGTCFETGEPVATLFAAADSPEACLFRLLRRRARWERRLLGRRPRSGQSVFR